MPGGPAGTGDRCEAEVKQVGEVGVFEHVGGTPGPPVAVVVPGEGPAWPPCTHTWAKSFSNFMK